MTNVHILALLAYAAFSVTDTAVKASGPSLSVFETAFIVNLFAAATLLLTRHPNEQWRDFWRTEHSLAVHGRALCGVMASLCGVYAFTTIPLAEAYALIFLAPLFVTILSAVTLKEYVGPWRWAALMAGFIGVILVIKPGFGAFGAGHLAAIGTGLGTGTAIIILRRVGGRVKTTSVLGTLIGYLLVLNAGILIFRGATLPTARECAFLALAGICYGLGQWVFVMAARYGNANQIAPMHYSQLGWAILFGMLFFNEFPDPLAVLGIIVITGAGLLTVIRDQVRARQARRRITAATAVDRA